MRVFRFVQGRDSVWRKHILQTDEADPQWRQVMRALGVDVAYALSPQAKGKIERPYRWLQDRIVRTCATEKLTAIDDVRAVLKDELNRYNNHQVHSTTGEVPSIRFARARKEGNSLFRPFTLPKPYTSTKDAFCLREKRMVNGYRTGYWHSIDGNLEVEVENTLLDRSYNTTAALINNPPQDLAPGEVVDDPVLTFTAADGAVVESLSQNLDLESPPYTWNLPDIGEGDSQTRLARIAAQSPFDDQFTPGFSASRALDQIEFTNTGGISETQTLTITATPATPPTPEEAIDELRFLVRVMPDDLVNATITSASSSWGGGVITPPPDRLDVSIENPVPGTPYTLVVNIDVELEDGVASASYKPRVMVAAHYLGDLEDVQGTTVTRNMELGDWTWETDDAYFWHVSEWQVKGVQFPEIQRNRVSVNFETIYNHGVRDGSLELIVPSTTAESQAWLGSNLHNRNDEIDEAVVDPILDLVTDQTVTHVKGEECLVIPPPEGIDCEWAFPNIEEDENFGGGTEIDQSAEFTTGFDVTRELTQTVFERTGGTQTLTLTVTRDMEVEMERLELHGNTSVSGLDIATVTSVSGENISISADGHSFHINIDDPAGPYVWTIEIEIDKLPDGYPEVYFEYIPHINVRDVDVIESGGFWGSSLSGDAYALDGTTVLLGNWSWQVTGDCSWWWEEKVSKQVNLEGYVEAQCNWLKVDFGTNYGFETACDSVDNIPTARTAWIGSNLHNQDDATDEDMVNPILDLVTDQTVTDVKREEYLVTPPPEGIDYRWQFPNNIVEDDEQDTGAGLTHTAEFTTGFSAYRSADQRRFDSQGTQILTVSVTPEEPMEKLQIHGRTNVDDLNIATVKSASGPNIDFNPDGYDFWAGVENPVAGNTYEWTIEIYIASLPSGYQAMEYMPQINVRNIVVSNNGSSYGSSLSGQSYDLDGTTALGTWTWGADGEYCWNWYEEVAKGVSLNGYAAPSYPVPNQEAINQAIDKGQEWLRSQQQPDG
ncbi:hypothetical protein ACFLW6_02950 [Chloroflexota bacterium]